nr:MAG TPA_asm: hypothetical protein [Caudoviricetes sp.]
MLSIGRFLPKYDIGHNRRARLPAKCVPLIAPLIHR